MDFRNMSSTTITQQLQQEQESGGTLRVDQEFQIHHPSFVRSMIHVKTCKTALETDHVFPAVTRTSVVLHQATTPVHQTLVKTEELVLLICMNTNAAVIMDSQVSTVSFRSTPASMIPVETEEHVFLTD